MKKYQPFPKVRSRKFTKSNSNMEQVNLQALFEQMQNMEQRIGALQIENNNLLQQQQQQQQQLQQQQFVQQQAPVVQEVPQRVDEFKIPDLIKGIPTFDGNKKQLTCWLASTRRILNIFRPRVTPDQFSMYELTVINKLEGKARDQICINSTENPMNFEQAAEILENVYGDRSDIASYQTQLWSLRMTDSIHTYFKKTKEIMTNMKALAKQNPIYNAHWEAISHFLENECLAAFLNGLSAPYFGYANTAQPTDLETAYAFVCKIQNAEKMKHQTKPVFEKNSKPPGKTYNDKKQSDRFKTTPMEVDTSTRSRNRLNINNNELKDETNNDNTKEDRSDSESESETEEEINFQITLKEKPKE